MQVARIVATVALSLAASLSSAAVSTAASEGAGGVCGQEVVVIPGFVSAAALSKPKPRYPTQALKEWSEGWVLLEYVVGADGAVRDLKVVDALGPKDFVKASVNSVSGWRYAPATRNGTPVDQYFYQTSVLFLFADSGRGADHSAFIRKYNRARKAITEKRYDEGIAILEEAFKARLNLYEEAMGSFVLALTYAQKTDWQRAQFHIRHATIEDGYYLGKALKATAFAMQVEIEARNASYAEARCAFTELRLIDESSAAGTSEAAKTVGRIESALADPKPLVSEATLAQHPMFEAPAVWRHALLRQKFSFARLKGEVKSFRLACVAAEHDAAVDEETQWNVPQQAGPCMLRVDGAPGASFLLIEER